MAGGSQRLFRECQDSRPDLFPSQSISRLFAASLRICRLAAGKFGDRNPESSAYFGVFRTSDMMRYRNTGRRTGPDRNLDRRLDREPDPGWVRGRDTGRDRGAVRGRDTDRDRDPDREGRRGAQGGPGGRRGSRSGELNLPSLLLHFTALLGDIACFRAFGPE